MADTAHDRLKQLDQERAALLADVKKEALARAHEAIARLRELGFDYRLVSAGSTRGAPSKAAGGTSSRPGVPPGAPCPICEFATNPPHDRRRHRAQGDRKRAFTDKQLEQLGLAKI